MSRATPKMREFAERLIDYEARGSKSSRPKTPAAFLIGEKLRPQLAALMGNTGFAALQSRALVLAIAEVPWLSALRVKADGSFEGLEECAAQATLAEMLEGKVVLTAQLLGLLIAFIGEGLTLRLVREVWPKLPFDSLDFGIGEKNEKPK